MWGIETPDPGEPTRLLAEGDTIELGAICLQVIEAPGIRRAASFYLPQQSREISLSWGTRSFPAVTAVPTFPAETRRRFCARSPSSPGFSRPIPFA